MEDYVERLPLRQLAVHDAVDVALADELIVPLALRRAHHKGRVTPVHDDDDVAVLGQQRQQAHQAPLGEAQVVPVAHDHEAREVLCAVLGHRVDGGGRGDAQVLEGVEEQERVYLDHQVPGDDEEERQQRGDPEPPEQGQEDEVHDGGPDETGDAGGRLPGHGRRHEADVGDDGDAADRHSHERQRNDQGRDGEEQHGSREEERLVPLEVLVLRGVALGHRPPVPGAVADERPPEGLLDGLPVGVVGAQPLDHVQVHGNAQAQLARQREDDAVHGGDLEPLCLGGGRLCSDGFLSLCRSVCLDGPLSFNRCLLLGRPACLDRPLRGFHRPSLRSPLLDHVLGDLALLLLVVVYVCQPVEADLPVLRHLGQRPAGDEVGGEFHGDDVERLLLRVDGLDVVGAREPEQRVQPVDGLRGEEVAGAPDQVQHVGAAKGKRLAAGAVVQQPRPGEALKLLDGVEVLADGQAGEVLPVALAVEAEDHVGRRHVAPGAHAQVGDSEQGAGPLVGLAVEVAAPGADEVGRVARVDELAVVDVGLGEEPQQVPVDVVVAADDGDVGGEDELLDDPDAAELGPPQKGPQRRPARVAGRRQHEAALLGEGRGHLAVVVLRGVEVLGVVGDGADEGERGGHVVGLGAEVHLHARRDAVDVGHQLDLLALFAVGRRRDLVDAHGVGPEHARAVGQREAAQDGVQRRRDADDGGVVDDDVERGPRVGAPVVRDGLVGERVLETGVATAIAIALALVALGVVDGVAQPVVEDGARQRLVWAEDGVEAEEADLAGAERLVLVVSHVGDAEAILGADVASM
ncbi:hypothetical protein O9K51_03777 [Purpureocillium lavendulum]|uniref:Uncharacterized protein n=1 Tax=Purpureocillium lavendulum TaxID=1247861 RepID=A0AB34FTK2_9HYPO|nr:hypothetical protein O9K51_03777 [Purpureocillium lavendulum]